MAKKVNRPLEGMTWPQLCLIRDVAMRHGVRPSRALSGLKGRRVSVVEFSRREYRLTREGERIWLAMQEWRPDMF